MESDAFRLRELLRAQTDLFDELAQIAKKLALENALLRAQLELLRKLEQKQPGVTEYGDRWYGDDL